MFLTIFTPTYNRAKLLPRVYNSLKNQTEKDFEWLIVDDGSSDATELVCNEFTKEKGFPVKYVKQRNNGKHIAINKGVSLAKGKYFFILDSDDFLPKNSVEILKNKSLKVDNHKEIGGLVGRKFTLDNKLIGNNLENELFSNSLDIRFKYKIAGDLGEVFKTRILREFTFPYFEDEKFCPEALVWNRIASKYSMLFFNENIYFAEYLDGGLTSKIIQLRMNSPKASMLYYAELASYKIPFMQKLKAYINYWRFAFNSEESIISKISKLHNVFGLFLYPLGYIMFLKDKRILNENSSYNK